MSVNSTRNLGTLGQALRLWETLRHLKPVQFYGRLWFRLARPKPDHRAAPTRRSGTSPWLPAAMREPSLQTPTRFRFLNCEADLAEVGWDDPATPKLWRYNQHYFDDLNSRDASRRAAWHASLIATWIKDNPPAQGSGWEPYPVSLRIINWTKWSWAGGTLNQEALQSLAVQARWLTRRLEWHLLGNHLFINAKALIFAGLFYEGAEADHWLSQGCAILERQLDEQFLDDGAQFELSPMYHALAFEDLLDLVNAAQAFPQSRLGPLAHKLRRHAEGAFRWLAALSHPDGKIAFFNDAAWGIAPDNAELIGYAERLGIQADGSTHEIVLLAPSGYARMQAGEAVTLVDLGKVGPDHLPGHAHADTLSFELSVAGQRIFVNSGTSEYGTGPERQRQRGTAAHNTVVVAGENSSDVWAGFRVGRRARPSNVQVGDHGGVLWADGRHDGYRHLKGAPRPHRRFELTPTSFRVQDCVNSDLPAEARYHLHPDVVVSDVKDAAAMLTLPDGRPLRLSAEGGPLRLEQASWHPEFGLSLPNFCLVLPLSNGNANLTLEWT